MASVLVIKSSTPCGACEVHLPMVAKVAKRHPRVQLRIIDDEHSWAKRLMNFPTTVLIEHGQIVWWYEGTMREDQLEKVFRMAEQT